MSTLSVMRSRTFRESNGSTLTERIGQLMADLWDAKLEIRRLEGENELLRGATDNRKRLTPLDVKHMRFLYKHGGMNQRELAEYYAVSTATVSRTVRRIYHGDIA